MGIAAVKVSKSHPVVKALLALTFPEYKGRKVYVDMSAKAYLEPVADGGTFDKIMAVNLSGEVAKLSVVPFSANHYRLASEPLAVPPGVALVVHSYFCGKDVGITIFVNPESMALGPAVAGLLHEAPLALEA